MDGKFVGSTPTYVMLASGDHTIKVSKKGYKGWERTLTTSGSSANVNAALEQEK